MYKGVTCKSKVKLKQEVTSSKTKDLLWTLEICLKRPSAKTKDHLWFVGRQWWKLLDRRRNCNQLQLDCRWTKHWTVLSEWPIFYLWTSLLFNATVVAINDVISTLFYLTQVVFLGTRFMSLGPIISKFPKPHDEAPGPPW